MNVSMHMNASTWAAFPPWSPPASPPWSPPPAPPYPIVEHALPLRTPVAFTLLEDRWWHGQVDLSHLDGASPLGLSVRVLRSASCSEGTDADGSCHFGLKLFGSTLGAVRVDDPAGALADSATALHALQRGGSYALVIDACRLQASRERHFHLSVWGWDGTNDVSVTVSPIPSITQDYCPEWDAHDSRIDQRSATPSTAPDAVAPSGSSRGGGRTLPIDSAARAQPPSGQGLTQPSPTDAHPLTTAAAVPPLTEVPSSAAAPTEAPTHSASSAVDDAVAATALARAPGSGGDEAPPPPASAIAGVVDGDGLQVSSSVTGRSDAADGLDEADRSAAGAQGGVGVPTSAGQLATLASDGVPTSVERGGGSPHARPPVPSRRQGHAAAFLPNDIGMHGVSDTAGMATADASARTHRSGSFETASLAAPTAEGSLYIFGGEWPLSASPAPPGAGAAAGAAHSADAHAAGAPRRLHERDTVEAQLRQAAGRRRMASGPRAGAKLADLLTAGLSSELWRFDLATHRWHRIQQRGGARVGVARVGVARDGVGRDGVGRDADESWPSARSAHTLTAAPAVLGPLLLLFGGSQPDGRLSSELWMYNATPTRSYQSKGRAPAREANRPTKANRPAMVNAVGAWAWNQSVEGDETATSLSGQVHATLTRDPQTNATTVPATPTPPEGWEEEPEQTDTDQPEAPDPAHGNRPQWKRLTPSPLWAFGSSTAAFGRDRYSSAPYSIAMSTYAPYSTYSYGPEARMIHAAVMLPASTLSAVLSTSRARTRLGGTVGALLVLGGVGYADPQREESRARATNGQSADAAGGGVHLSLYGGGALPSRYQLLPDVWMIALNGPAGAAEAEAEAEEGAEGEAGSLLGEWQHLEWRYLRTGEQPARRYGHSAAVLPDGSVFMFGGMVEVTDNAPSVGLQKKTVDVEADASAWTFTTATTSKSAWEPVRRIGAWPPARAFHTATVASDALILFGGRGASGDALADMWLFRGRKWTELAVRDPLLRRACGTPVGARACWARARAGRACAVRTRNEWGAPGSGVPPSKRRASLVYALGPC